MNTYTEAEAKEKWCPFARVVVDAPGYGAGNRFDSSKNGQGYQAETRCIGSGCMAWQWVNMCGGYDYRDKANRSDECRLGFCGAFARKL